MISRLNLNAFYFFSLLLPLLISASAAAQSSASPNQSSPTNSPDEVLRVDTNLVTVLATVRDRDGRYVTDLQKEDFKIMEDGTEQEAAFFAPVEKPFTVLLLLDVSGSMSYRMEDLALAANTFVRQLRPDDEITAITFADSSWTHVLFQPTKVSQLRKGIKLQQHADQHNTIIYDAVDFALKRMKKIQGRKAIVLFSDGVGTGIFATEKGTLRKAEEEEAAIYTVQFNTYSSSFPAAHVANKKQYYEYLETANNYMTALAQKTGGRHFQIENISDLSKTFGQVADELRRQYSLGYYPKKPIEAGQTRHIAVKVRVSNLAVTARDSYIARKQ